MITVVFRSRLRDEDDEEYAALAPRMLELARATPGFVAFASFTSDDGERLALAHFESLEAVDAWREQAEHVEAQRRGRERFYSGYTIEVCEQVRAYGFDGEQRVGFDAAGVRQ